jgi:hypothetical protein
MKTYYPMFISMATARFECWEEIADLISEFERGALPHARWKHREHLTVAFWYLSRLGEAAATDRIRAGILFLNDCHGTPNTDTRGYHETLTRFWIGVVVKFLKESDAGRSELEMANQLIDEYAGRAGLWRDYYSFDLLKSVESRRRWIEPDMRPEGGVWDRQTF